MTRVDWRQGLVGCAFLALSGCAELERQGQLFTSPPPLPPSRPNIAEPPHRADTRANVQHKELVAQFGGEYHAPSAERYL
ncbi:MAG: peptidase M48, partial [Methylocystis sp.]|nr:peptidase M48 [Methylocystis sp.]